MPVSTQHESDAMPRFPGFKRAVFITLPLALLLCLPGVSNARPAFGPNCSGCHGAPVLATNPANGGKLNFGNTRVGENSVATFTLQNLNQNSPHGGGFGGSFPVPGAATPFTLNGDPTIVGDATRAPGYLTPQLGSESRDYIFTPTSRGTSSTSISFTPDPGFSPTAPTVTIDLSGTGVGPQFGSSVAPGSTIDFGNLVAWNASQMLTLSNTTPDPDLGPLTTLTILSYSITGADAGLFSLANFVADSTLAKDGTLDQQIDFKSGGLRGTHTAILSFLTDEGAAFGGNGNSYLFNLQAYLVPEPGTYALLLAGLCGLGLALRSRQSTKPVLQGHPGN